MGDIYCRVCGEPWDAYGVRNGDMEPEEADTFLKGKGCPCCKGKKPEGANREALEEEFLSSITGETDEDPIAVLEYVEM